MTNLYHLAAVVVIAVVATSVAAPQRATKYTTKYDNIDVDRILGNSRILTSYIKCLMEEGPCTAEGRELKKTLPDAIRNDCNGCNENQKTMAEKVIAHLRTVRSRDWDRLAKKYDPNGEFKKRFEKAAAAQAAAGSPTVAPAPKPKEEAPIATKKEAAPVPTTNKATGTTSQPKQTTTQTTV